MNAFVTIPATRIAAEVDAMHSLCGRSLAEISRDMLDMRAKVDTHPGRSHLGSDEEQEAYWRLAARGLDLEVEWQAAFQRETGVSYDMIRCFL